MPSTDTTYPLQAPAWAMRSIPEDGAVTHETVSAIHPQVVAEWPPTSDARRPIEVSLSVTDRLAGGRWVRSTPTVQVEGGAFPLTEIPRLVRALLEIARLPRQAPTD